MPSSARLNFQFDSSMLAYIFKFRMLAGPSSQSITIKLVMFFLLLLVDIVLSSFVEASFTLKVTSDMATNTTFIVHVAIYEAGAACDSHCTAHHDTYHDVADFPAQAWIARHTVQRVPC
jgi:hypothetical protein